MRHRRLVLLLPLLAMLAPGAASACSFTHNYRPTPAQIRSVARGAVEGAAAIIDGEVIRPFVYGGAPALVRAHRVLRGPRQAVFAVGERDSCSVTLTAMGARSRMILVGGPDVYFIEMGRVSDRAVDRILGSDRRRDWPDVAGIEAAR